MATQRKLRRGTQAENDAFTGAEGETVYTTDTKRLYNHDGSTQGGIAIPNGFDIQTQKFNAADGAGTDTITLTLATLGQAPTAYAEYQSFTFKPAADNTGAVTLNVDSLGAKDVKKDDGAGALIALEAGDLQQDIPIQVIYDGTQFIAQLGGGGGGVFESALLHIRQEQTSGTGGGTTPTSWTARVLNTVKTNEISGASLSSNQITLPAGTYWIEANSPHNGSALTSCRLYNVTDAGEEIKGESTRSVSNSQIHCEVAGRFTIAGTKTFELQIIGGVGTGNGLGQPTSDGTEVYAWVKIWKVG